MTNRFHWSPIGGIPILHYSIRPTIPLVSTVNTHLKSKPAKCKTISKIKYSLRSTPRLALTCLAAHSLDFNKLKCVFSGPYLATWNLQSGPTGGSRALLLNSDTPQQHLRPLKQERSLLLQQGTGCSDPCGSLVRVLSDQRGSSILRQGCHSVMLLGNGTLRLPIMW